MKNVKSYLLVRDGYIVPNAEDVICLPYNYQAKKIEQHLSDIAAELGLTEWFAVYLAGSYFTGCYTSSGKGIHLLNIPENHVARIDCNWNNEPILLFAGREEEAGLRYENQSGKSEADGKNNQKLKEYILLADGYTKLLNPDNADVRQFREGKDLETHIKEIAAELNLKGWEWVFQDGQMGKAPKGAVARITPNWYYGTIYIYIPTETEESENREIISEPPPAYAGMTEAERRYEERKWDNLYNESGEGFNPYRLPEIEPIIEPQDY